MVITSINGGTDSEVTDVDTTNFQTNFSFAQTAAGADVVLAQGTAELGGDLDISSTGDIVLGDGSGGAIINVDASGVAISLTAARSLIRMATSSTSALQPAVRSN